MGTNYYYRTATCPMCGHSKDETHIGKSSGGWTFAFHGTEEIRSYADWLRVLASGEGEIFDEYDRKVTVEEFKELVESKRFEEFNHAAEAIAQRLSCCGDWIDPDGNSFSPGDFS